MKMEPIVFKKGSGYHKGAHFQREHPPLLAFNSKALEIQLIFFMPLEIAIGHVLIYFLMVLITFHVKLFGEPTYPRDLMLIPEGSSNAAPVTSGRAASISSEAHDGSERSARTSFLYRLCACCFGGGEEVDQKTAQVAAESFKGSAGRRHERASSRDPLLAASPAIVSDNAIAAPSAAAQAPLLVVQEPTDGQISAPNTPCQSPLRAAVIIASATGSPFSATSVGSATSAASRSSVDSPAAALLPPRVLRAVTVQELTAGTQV